MSTAQSNFSATQGAFWNNSTLQTPCGILLFVYNLDLILIPFPHVAEHADHSVHGVTLHFGSMYPSKSVHFSTCPMHGSFSTSSICAHAFRALRSMNFLVRIFVPFPHETLHSDHSDHDVVSHGISPTQFPSQFSFSIKLVKHPDCLAFCS